MDTIEKVYCTGHDNNDALVSADNCYSLISLIYVRAPSGAFTYKDKAYGI